jgi:hypothetical protein
MVPLEVGEIIRAQRDASRSANLVDDQLFIHSIGNHANHYWRSNHSCCLGCGSLANCLLVLLYCLSPVLVTANGGTGTSSKCSTYQGTCNGCMSHCAEQRPGTGPNGTTRQGVRAGIVGLTTWRLATG